MKSASLLRYFIACPCLCPLRERRGALRRIVAAQYFERSAIQFLNRSSGELAGANRDFGQHRGIRFEPEFGTDRRNGGRSKGAEVRVSLDGDRINRDVARFESRVGCLPNQRLAARSRFGRIHHPHE